MSNALASLSLTTTTNQTSSYRLDSVGSLLDDDGVLGAAEERGRLVVDAHGVARVPAEVQASGVFLLLAAHQLELQAGVLVVRHDAQNHVPG